MTWRGLRSRRIFDHGWHITRYPPDRGYVFTSVPRDPAEKVENRAHQENRTRLMKGCVPSRLPKKNCLSRLTEKMMGT